MKDPYNLCNHRYPSTLLHLCTALMRGIRESYCASRFYDIKNLIYACLSPVGKAYVLQLYTRLQIELDHGQGGGGAGSGAGCPPSESSGAKFRILPTDLRVIPRQAPVVIVPHIAEN